MPGPRRRSVLASRLVPIPGVHSGEAISGELRRCLLDGEAPPGTLIPLDEVAAVFGVSRIPVREALKTLMAEGLVEHRPNAGYRVAELSMAEVREMYLVREALETAALTAALELADPEADAEAEAAHRAMGRAVAAEDVSAHHRESRRFHLALVSSCGMPRMLQTFETAWNVTEPLRSMAYVSTDQRAELQSDHQDMLTAFLGRDLPALLACSARHHERLQILVATPPGGAGRYTARDMEA